MELVVSGLIAKRAETVGRIAAAQTLLGPLMTNLDHLGASIRIFQPDMRDNAQWEAQIKGLLKGELKRRGVSYLALVDKLAAIGVVDSEPNIRNKLSRGKFTAVFLVQCLEAIGVQTLSVR